MMGHPDRITDCFANYITEETSRQKSTRRGMTEPRVLMTGRHVNMCWISKIKVSGKGRNSPRLRHGITTIFIGIFGRAKNIFPKRTEMFANYGELASMFWAV